MPNDERKMGCRQNSNLVSKTATEDNRHDSANPAKHERPT
jgi:hypothetical protein